MATRALIRWRTDRQAQLQALREAFLSVRRRGPGTPDVSEPLQHAYLVSVAAQFQGFCRDLHSEAVSALVDGAPDELRTILQVGLSSNRRLEHGNANEASIAGDFERLGMENFWRFLAGQAGSQMDRLRERLAQMNLWRNAIAHDNFERIQHRIGFLEGCLRPTMVEADECLSACAELATRMDAAVQAFLVAVGAGIAWD